MIRLMLTTYLCVRPNRTCSQYEHCIIRSAFIYTLD